MPLGQHKYACLMSTNRQALIRTRQEPNSSLTSQMSNISIASSNVSDFLAEKINHLAIEREILMSYRDGLFGAKQANLLEEEDFRTEL